LEQKSYIEWIWGGFEEEEMKSGMFNKTPALGWRKIEIHNYLIRCSSNRRFRLLESKKLISAVTLHSVNR